MRRRATSIVLPIALVVGLSGCTFTAPQTNQLAYDPSDGFGGSVGAVELRNVLLVTDAEQAEANLVMSAINSGDRSVRLVVSWENADGTQIDRNVYLKAGGARTFGEEPNQFVIGNVDADPGALFPVYFQYGNEPGEQLAVPVLDGTLPEYEDLVPAS